MPCSVVSHHNWTQYYYVSLSTVCVLAKENVELDWFVSSTIFLSKCFSNKDSNSFRKQDNNSEDEAPPQSAAIPQTHTWLLTSMKLQWHKVNSVLTNWTDREQFRWSCGLKLGSARAWLQGLRSPAEGMNISP
jgi:hypothetical protein